jgi:hypothetical protein
MKKSYNEFHIRRDIRTACSFPDTLFSSAGTVIFHSLKSVRLFTVRFNEYIRRREKTEKQISAGMLNAMGLLDEIFHIACMAYRKTKYPAAMTELLTHLNDEFGKADTDRLLLEFIALFPPHDVYTEKTTAEIYLDGTGLDAGTGRVRTNREAVLEELLMLHLANENPAFQQFGLLFHDQELQENPMYQATWEKTKDFFATLPKWGMYAHDLITFLKEPVAFSPDSLHGQLDYVYAHWADLLEGQSQKDVLSGIDLLNEEQKPRWEPMSGGGPEMNAPHYEDLTHEYERFSPDRDWMPNVVLMAKTVLVWLFQLSCTYNRSITQLDQIPDEELDTLRDEGFTGLWLIGLWQRSVASRKIKQLCGNPEAAASAYSLYDYEIADSIGGWTGLENLRTRLWQRGIRLASDMVPNHTGMDSRWVTERPDLFVQRRDNPFPQYTYSGTNLSNDPRISIYLEDHYYAKTDCAVVFKRVDNATGDTRYIYHGNDGTGMPWNDTAQIDFLNPQAREAVIQEIIHVARNFPIIRFDAAMVLAKKHIRRLWYPEPGQGGDIATRSEYSLTADTFERRIPVEFWREVVDRIAREVPDTLLLAEAFWMMEGYFTRTLGMHRVYNSAFMNMLKKEENQKYRDTVKNTIIFDPEILKRFVNFMNNPDEETAVAQFGKGDKYFGVCTLMITMPGLPMFGHGQIEGFEEKYGMEYTRAYRNEQPDQQLLERHRHDIFPLAKKRYLFAQIENFLFFDVWNNGAVNENIFAYCNSSGQEYALVFYNNTYASGSGWIKESVPYAHKTGPGESDRIVKTRTLAEGLNLTAHEATYCIFREQRSGLWFIRSSADIAEHGLFVMLNGFENQILVDFREEKDGNDKKWQQLCSFLNGSGTTDLAAAWQDYYYRDLYDALRTLFEHKSFPMLLPQQTTKKRQRSLRAIEKALEPAALAFYTAACRIAQEKPTAKKNRRLPAPTQQFSHFKKELSFIIRNTEKKQSKTNPGAYFADGVKFYEQKQLIFTLFALITDIAAAGYAAPWGLDRKIPELMNNIQTATPEMNLFLKKAFVLAADKRPVTTTPEKMRLSAGHIADTLVAGRQAPLLTGAHEFNAIKWFNKELSDESLFMAIALPMLRASAKKQAELLKLSKLLDKAKTDAQYQCDLFTRAFVSEKTTQPHRGRK